MEGMQSELVNYNNNINNPINLFDNLKNGNIKEWDREKRNWIQKT
jgi:hypothetical protein